MDEGIKKLQAIKLKADERRAQEEAQRARNEETVQRDRIASAERWKQIEISLKQIAMRFNHESGSLELQARVESQAKFNNQPCGYIFLIEKHDKSGGQQVVFEIDYNNAVYYSIQHLSRLRHKRFRTVKNSEFYQG